MPGKLTQCLDLKVITGFVLGKLAQGLFLVN